MKKVISFLIILTFSLTTQIHTQRYGSGPWDYKGVGKSDRATLIFLPGDKLVDYQENPIKKTTVTNNTNNDIYVTFTGFGCSGQQVYGKMTCKKSILQPGQIAFYDWGKQVNKEIIVQAKGYNFRSKEIKPNYNWQGFEEKKEFDSQKGRYFMVGIPKSKDFNTAIEGK